jgi:hypothetical protein
MMIYNKQVRPKRVKIEDGRVTGITGTIRKPRKRFAPFHRVTEKRVGVVASLFCFAVANETKQHLGISRRFGAEREMDQPCSIVGRRFTQRRFSPEANAVVLRELAELVAEDIVYETEDGRQAVRLQTILLRADGECANARNDLLVTLESGVRVPRL